MSDFSTDALTLDARALDRLEVFQARHDLVLHAACQPRSVNPTHTKVMPTEYSTPSLMVTDIISASATAANSLGALVIFASSVGGRVRSMMISFCRVGEVRKSVLGTTCRVSSA